MGKDSNLRNTVQEFNAAKNKNDSQKMEGLLHSDFVGYVGGKTIGREEYILSINTLHQGFSNLKFIIEDMIQEGEKIAVRLLVTGKNSGFYLGHEASNCPIKYSGITMKRIVNGKIIEEWQVNDSLTMLHQIGLSVNHII